MLSFILLYVHKEKIAVLEIYQKNITTLIESKYPRVKALDPTIKKMIIDQLFWVQENTQFTPQADTVYETNG